MEKQTLSQTLSQMRNFAETVADAYVNQYVDPDGRKVMGQPVVYFNRTSQNFGWCSSMTPLSDDEVAVEWPEEGGYGETSEDPEIERDALIDMLMTTVDWSDMLDKIVPAESNF